LYMRSRYADWPKVQVVHCGIEPGFYEVAGTGAAQLPRLVCVGRLCEAKGQLLLVEAAARMAARGVPFELVLAGDGPMRGELEAQIRNRGLAGRIRITGWISSADVRREILAARAMVLPTFAEGLPVVIMEAMSLRRPVLSTYVAGIPELVRPGRTGWLFPAGSVDELVKAMEECLSSSAETLQAMGEAARETALARHSIETEAAKLAKLIRNSLAGIPCPIGEPASSTVTSHRAESRGQKG
ncbi:MAG: glycosyltransferase, partial [Steroidobacteraceae bacterium]